MKKLLLICLLSAAPAFAQGVLLERGVEGASPNLRAVSERVRIRIDRQYAQTVLEQEFDNVSDQRLEGRYVLRTAGATVEGFAYWNGEQKIVGEVFDTENRGLAMLTDWPTLARAIPRLAPQWYDVALRPGTNARAYANALGGLGPGFDVSVNANNPFFLTLVGMIGLLTLMLALVAGLGVLNTVVLTTRERVHDIGVFKALGMTPRQIIVTVVCWVAGTGLAAGLLAVPAGIALHRYVLPVMARSAGTNVPASFLHVYRLDELALLGLSGLVIAVLGALLPAGWAAKVSTASALRAE